MPSSRLFLLALAVTLGYRFWLAAALPITGDDAYYILWGRNFAWGYYDHPPAIGWWLAAMQRVSDADFWMRLPTVLQPALLAFAVAATIGRVWPEVEPERKWWAALLVLLAPASIWDVFVTTDMPLIYFAVLSGLAWLRAGENDDGRWYFVSGLLLAGAVLSKFFAVLLGFAYLIDTLLRRRPGMWRGLLIVYACTVPALVQMVWWNMGNCWPNLMFNFVTRNEEAGLSWRTPGLYVATLAYVLTPPVLWLLLARGGGTLTAGCRSLVTLSLVPFGLFALLSPAKTIGLHWLLAFVPFALMPLALRLSLRGLRRLFLFFAGFAVLHMVAIAVLLKLPLETWQDRAAYPSLVLTFDPQAVLDPLAPYAKDYVFASDGYSNAVTLGHAAGRHFVTFGQGSHHGRHEDILDDFRTLEGRNILIVRKTEPAPGEYLPYFRRVEMDTMDVRGARFWLVRGQGFDLAAYRERLLRPLRERYYALPSWLPQTGCYFCDRYFPGEYCRR